MRNGRTEIHIIFPVASSIIYDGVTKNFLENSAEVINGTPQPWHTIWHSRLNATSI